jgi:DHA2 family multidrug resistance protein
MMTVFLLSTQYVLEEGSSNSWFADDVILWLAVLAVISGIAFVWRQITYRQPIVSLKPFIDRNFSIGIVMMFVTGASLFGGMFILPLFLAQILQYSAAQVGSTMMIGGLTMFASAPLAGQVVRRVDARVAMVVGFAITGFGMAMGARVTPNWGYGNFALMQVVRSVGVMLAMIASQQITVSTLPHSLMKDASGLLNLIRNVGGAVGLAVLSTVLTHQTAVHMGDLTALVNAGSAGSQGMMAGLQEMMTEQGNPDPTGASYKAFDMLLHRNAAVLAFGDAFVLLAAGCWTAAALALFAKPSPQGQAPAGGGH